MGCRNGAKPKPTPKLVVVIVLFISDKWAWKPFVVVLYVVLCCVTKYL